MRLQINDWNVVEVKSQNGIRIGISQEEDGVVLESMLTENEAIKKCDSFCLEFGIPTFDNNLDVLV